MGLYIHAGRDDHDGPTGAKLSDAMLADLALERDDFHVEWSYRLNPRDINQHGEEFRLFLLASQWSRLLPWEYLGAEARRRVHLGEMRADGDHSLLADEPKAGDHRDTLSVFEPGVCL